MEKQICTMAWKAEVTFYREIEGTENLASYLPNRWIQSCEYRVSLVPVLGEVQTVFIKGKDYFLNQVPPEENNCEGWNCRGLKERTLLKGFGWASGFRPLPASAVFCYSGGGGQGGVQQRASEVQPTLRSSCHDISGVNASPFRFLATALCFCFPRKEHIPIVVVQMAMFFGNLPAGKEITKGWWLTGTLLCLRMPLHCLFWWPFACKGVFCHLDRSTSMLCAICSSGVEILLRLTPIGSFWACERFLSSSCC